MTAVDLIRNISGNSFQASLARDAQVARSFGESMFYWPKNTTNFSARLIIKCRQLKNDPWFGSISSNDAWPMRPQLLAQNMTETSSILHQYFFSIAQVRLKLNCLAWRSEIHFASTWMLDAANCRLVVMSVTLIRRQTRVKHKDCIGISSNRSLSASNLIRCAKWFIANG